MSDPVTNDEVEDVLSSIRRLVSEEKRHGRSDPLEKPAERLVLTPALRVENQKRDAGTGTADSVSTGPSVGDETADQNDLPPASVPEEEDTPFYEDAADEDAAEPSRESPSLDAEQSDREQTRERLSRLLDADPHEETGAEPSDDGGEAGNASHEEPEPEEPAKPTTPIFRHTRMADFERARRERERAEAAAAEPEETSEPENDPAARLSYKIAQLETAIGNISEQWEPDGTGEDDYSGTEAPAMAWEDDTETDEAERYGVVSDDEAEDASVFYDESEARVDGDEPDGSGTEGVAEEPAERAPDSASEPQTDFARMAEAFASARGTPEEPLRPESAGLDLSSDETLLDEEMLRDLVSEIVREELQGALGERITRNVRKLVRREIHRALSAQDLE
jgi:hypothetical protein